MNRYFNIKLLWKWIISIAVRNIKHGELGTVIMSIDIHERGNTITMFRETSARGYLVTTAASQFLIETALRTNDTLSEQDIGKWDDLSRMYSEEGIHLPMLMALREIESHKAMMSDASNVDVQ